MASIRIAIIGAGPVGLMLARLLANCPTIKLVVFEAEHSANFRGQGGTLDLHSSTGLIALQEAGLYEEFIKRARFDGEALTICDKNVVKYVNIPGADPHSSRGRPEIDRMSLREILLNSIPRDLIRWGYRLRAIDENRALIFDHCVEAGFDLVVGADGAWSKIRSFVSGQKPEYTGIGGFEWIIPDAQNNAAACYKLVNRGSLFSHSDGRAILSQQLGDGSLSLYTFACDPEEKKYTSTSEHTDTEVIRTAILEKFHDWHPELVEFIQKAQEPRPRPLYMLPVGWLWRNRPGVTLIGDAAHVMTPFGGEGVNLGLQDALMLSQAIIKASNSPNPDISLPIEIESFEKELFMRAEETASLTNDMKQWMFFTDGSPRSVIEKVSLRMMTFHEKGLISRLRYPILAAFI